MTYINKIVTGDTAWSIYSRLSDIGIEKPVVEIIWRFANIFEEDPISFSSNGIEAKFRNESPPEYLMFNNFLDGEELTDFILEVEKSDTVIDIGANVGIFSVFAGVQEGVEVIAVEPFPQNAMRIRENFEINDISGDIFECALGDESDEYYFKPSSNYPGAQGGQIVKEGGENVIKTKVKTGDALLETACVSPDVVKIDVEGFEKQVLSGLEKHLPEIRTVYCEVHDEQSIEQISNILSSHGHNVSQIGEKGEEVFLKSKRES